MDARELLARMDSLRAERGDDSSEVTEAEIRAMITAIDAGVRNLPRSRASEGRAIVNRAKAVERRRANHDPDAVWWQFEDLTKIGKDLAALLEG